MRQSRKYRPWDDGELERRRLLSLSIDVGSPDGGVDNTGVVGDDPDIGPDTGLPVGDPDVPDPDPDAPDYPVPPPEGDPGPFPGSPPPPIFPMPPIGGPIGPG